MTHAQILKKTPQKTGINLPIAVIPSVVTRQLNPWLQRGMERKQEFNNVKNFNGGNQTQCPGICGGNCESERWLQPASGRPISNMPVWRWVALAQAWLCGENQWSLAQGWGLGWDIPHYHNELLLIFVDQRQPHDHYCTHIALLLYMQSTDMMLC